MIISVRGRTRLAGVILAVGLISSSGCSVSVSGGGGAAGAAPAEGTVEFPETGDALIVTTNPTQGDMTVFGDSATGMVSRIVLTHPNGAMDAEFDGQGRPTRVVLDGSAVFDITYDADGTSNYTLTENGTVISTDRNLTPAKGVDLSTPGLFAKQDSRLQSTELDALLCAGSELG